MSENEAVLKLTSKADLTDLLAWTRSIRDAREQMVQFQAAGGATDGTGNVSVAPSVGQGMASSGGAPPTPLPAGGGAAPPPPGQRNASGGGAPPLPAAAHDWETAPTVIGGAGRGAAPPPPEPAHGGGRGGSDDGSGGSRDGRPPPKPKSQKKKKEEDEEDEDKKPPKPSPSESVIIGMLSSGKGGGLSAMGSTAGSALGSVIGGAAGPVGAAAGGMIGGALGSAATGEGALGALVNPPAWLARQAWSGAKALGSAAVGAGERVAGMAYSTTLQQNAGVSSLWDIPGASLNKYLQLSKVMVEIDARFASATEKAQWFGKSMGYTTEMAAGMAKALGAQTGEFTEAQGKRYAGFGRQVGLGNSPDVALSALGRVQALGADTSNAGLGAILGTLRNVGMGTGRIEEGLGQVTSIASRLQERTGSVSIEGITRGLMMGTALYGGDSTRALRDPGIVQGMDSAISNPAAQTAIMRMAGFGQRDASGRATLWGKPVEEGRSYIEMQKSLESGVDDPRNVTSLMGYMQGAGASAEQQTIALRTLSGGQLKWHQADALVQALGTPDKLSKFSAILGAQTGEEREAAGASLMGSLTKEEKDALSKAGFEGLGKGKISIGESQQQRIESLQLEVGAKMVEFIPAMNTIFDNVAEALGEAGGEGIWGIAHQIADLLVDASGELKRIKEILSGIGVGTMALLELAAGMVAPSAYAGSFDPLLKQSNRGKGSAGIMREAIEDAVQAGQMITGNHPTFMPGGGGR